MTNLHYWVCEIMDDSKEDSCANVQRIVEKGADLLAQNSWGFTPLLNAANGNYCWGRPNLKVLDFLLDREEYSRAEKIEAMELAGAVILQNTKNASLFHKGFEYWRKALILRQTGDEGSGLIEKPKLNLMITEWNTSVELEDVIEHPDNFLIQSFLVRLRIFSSKKWDAIKFLFESNLVYYCLNQLEQKFRSVEIYNIIWATLETLLSRPDLHKNGDAQRKIGIFVEKLIDVFARLQTVITEEIIKTSLDLIISANEVIFLIRYSYLIRFVRILSHLPQSLLNKDAMKTISEVRDQHGRNLLHKAFVCAIDDDHLYATVRLLLNAGCDTNATDHYGKTPLHILTELIANPPDRRYWFRHLNTIAMLLLDFGAQLSIKNQVGKTAVEVLIRKNKRNRDKDEQGIIIGWKLPDWCSELPTLTCLSARVIRRNRIPHLALPLSLISMIEKPKITEL